MLRSRRLWNSGPALVLLALASAALAQDRPREAALPPAGKEDPGRRPAGPAPLQYWCRARQILVSFAGAKRARASRSKDEAARRAAALARLARDEGRDFAALARGHSDGPRASAGGALGPAFRFAQVNAAFAKAAYALAPGQVSDPVETPFGFHIILREPLVEFGVERLLVAFGSDEMAALKRAEALLSRARAGEDFAALARESDSDEPALGVVAEGLIEREAEEALAELADGAVAPELIESATGFLILRRVKPALARGGHILIDFKGAFRSMATRSREQARGEAEALIARLGSGAVELGVFEALARRHSALERVDLGPVPRRGPQMEAAIRDALYSAAPGRIAAAPAESRFGFHVVWRAP